MLRSLQGEQMYGRNGMIEIYTDQESDFIHLLQNKQALDIHGYTSQLL